MVRSSRVLYGVVPALALAACKPGDATTESNQVTVVTDSALQPQFSKTTSQPNVPPPISGGTLAVSKTSPIAVAADPDRDRVYVVDLSLRSVRFSAQLAPATEPGRVALDEEGHAFVALRRSGELATIDLANGSVDVKSACIAPRGVAWDRWRKRVLVACASGTLMAFPRSGAPYAISGLGMDLRDVVVREQSLEFSSFRTARMQRRNPDGSQSDLPAPNLANAEVAWRMRDLGNEDGVPVNVIAAQEATTEVVGTTPGGYAHSTPDQGGGIVQSRVWVAQMKCSEDDTGPCTRGLPLPFAVLPVDLATNGQQVVVVAAGNAFTQALPQIFVVGAAALRKPESLIDPTSIISMGMLPRGQAVAADFSSIDELIVQTREPAQLHIMSDDRLRSLRAIDLATDSRRDTGHEIFHANAGGMIACASCHAEGADDGHTWTFDPIGPRRTPSLLGTTAHTEPFHWDGDMKDLASLVDHVFVERMTGPRLSALQVEALGHYLFSLPAPPRLRSVSDVSARGKDLFEKRCGVCHSGAMMTNNQSLDVGTGAKFQVPSLVGVAWRGPWIHNGCAETLFDRFDPACGGANHAELKDLSDADKSFLVEYMESL